MPSNILFGPAGAASARKIHFPDVRSFRRQGVRIHEPRRQRCGRSVPDLPTPSTRISVTEDYAAEIDELSSLKHKLGVLEPSEFADAWKQGYPYEKKMSRREYERKKRRLQIELLKLQLWVKETGQKVLIIFEGRDAAGKGGSIKRFTEHLNPPRGARVVALEKPTDIERTQWYFQRYVAHLPSGGEIVMMDRSWYNRAGVERVMGYCTPTQYLEFMRETPGLRADARQLRDSSAQAVVLGQPRRAVGAVRGPPNGPGASVEALTDRSGFARQVGRLHPGQGSHVLLHRYRGMRPGR